MLCPLTYLQAVLLGAPFGRAMGSYPELCVKWNFYLCHLAFAISEKRIASLVVHLPILRLQIEGLQSMGTCIKLVTNKSMIFFLHLKKLDNWDPTDSLSIMESPEKVII